MDKVKINVDNMLNNSLLEKNLKSNLIEDKKALRMLSFAVASRILEHGGIIMVLSNVEYSNENTSIDYFTNFGHSNTNTIDVDDKTVLLLFTSEEKFNSFAEEDDEHLYGGIIHIEHLPQLVEHLGNIDAICVNAFNENYLIPIDIFKDIEELVSNILKLGVDYYELEYDLSSIYDIDNFDVMLEFFFDVLIKRLEDLCKEFELFADRDISRDNENVIYLILAQYLGISVDEAHQRGVLKDFDGLPDDVSDCVYEFRNHIAKKLDEYLVDRYKEEYGSLPEEFFITHMKYIDIYNDVFEGKVDIRGIGFDNVNEIVENDILKKAFVVWSDIAVYPELIDGYDDYSNNPVKLEDHFEVMNRMFGIVGVIKGMQFAMMILHDLFTTLLEK